jgi:hypothetical protein
MNPTSTGNYKGTYKDNSAGQRQGAIGHYASRIVAAFVMSNRIETEEDAIVAFNKIVKGIEEGFGK